ncbi:hypothetical protein AArcCO_2036 [Halalkaliarchaeum sp. AArc-CO]|uniref:hypothetical protein n=1 Tax=unclassified Halalkaliarchaeum TaxID=2678344 RepID=UPI00217D6143|nr:MULTISPECIES: hypothetical protein [unclassified Halalkaliarchaeum]MDR5671829.1 hypothetical protein [Halalkaliarchaeum sp. AArc-GB]UWG51332.1 hypothetical protein AArcCO_2036 [Halalkaliarchaeum sp. AArc-CO]
MNQRSRRLRLAEWADLVDEELPERALERPTLSAFPDGHSDSEDDGDGRDTRNPRGDGRGLHRRSR